MAEPRSGIAVTGEGLPPKFKQPLAESTRQLLTDAVHNAMNAAVTEMNHKLKVADEVERDLLNTAFRWIDDDRGPGNPTVALSLFLLRPGDPAQRPHTIEVAVREHVIRMTRSFGRIDGPTALVTLATVSDGRFKQMDIFLAYTDSRWRLQQPSVERQTIR